MATTPNRRPARTPSGLPLLTGVPRFAAVGLGLLAVWVLGLVFGVPIWVNLSLALVSGTVTGVAVFLVLANLSARGGRYITVSTGGPVEYRYLSAATIADYKLEPAPLGRAMLMLLVQIVVMLGVPLGLIAVTAVIAFD